MRPEDRLRLGTALAEMRRQLGLTNADVEALERRERQSLVVGALPDEVVGAIEAAAYGVEPE